MPTAAELYDAILADPDNVDLRLQYADAVSDTDPDHAELIRLDIEKERLGRQSLRLPLDQSTRRRSLSRSLGPRLARDVAPLVASWQLRRGFPEVVKMSAESFLSTGAEVYRRAPVRHLIVTDATGFLDQLMASPLLRRLASLDLTGNPIGDEGVETLVRSPHLGRLRFLSLSWTGAGKRGAEALAAAQTLPRLQYLDFVGNDVELTPKPAAQDAISGELLEVEYPALGKELADVYGPKPWLAYTSPNPAVELYRTPDYGEA